jgi:lipoate-protein ligase A
MTADNGRTFRLIFDSIHDGATNMAVDEAILDSVVRGDSPPTLRLYRWEPACLSLGYGQRAADADHARLAEYGWDLVRRMTGGRAILHTDEITYSLALPGDHPLVAGSIVESYRRLSAALLAGLEQLGLAAHADKRDKGTAGAQHVGPVCFEVPSDYEITANGRKLIGSAQVRPQGGGVLQHGSVPLYGDVSRICEALAFPDEAARREARARVLDRATTLEGALGRCVTWDEAAEALAAAFANTFTLDLIAADLSAAEVHRAAELSQSRYDADAWNLLR